MKTKVTVLDSFVHGRHDYKRGQETTFSKPEAEELEKAGLVTIGGEAADDGVDDLLGSEKMEPLTLNKMEQAPDNKAAGKAKAK
jgi:hypothetical protein